MLQKPPLLKPPFLGSWFKVYFSCMQCVFVTITKLTASKNYFCKEVFCNNFGRDGIITWRKWNLRSLDSFFKEVTVCKELRVPSKFRANSEQASQALYFLVILRDESPWVAVNKEHVSPWRKTHHARNLAPCRTSEEPKGHPSKGRREKHKIQVNFPKNFLRLFLRNTSVSEMFT